MPLGGGSMQLPMKAFSWIWVAFAADTFILIQSDTTLACCWSGPSPKRKSQELVRSAWYRNSLSNMLIREVLDFSLTSPLLVRPDIPPRKLLKRSRTLRGAKLTRGSALRFQHANQEGERRLVKDPMTHSEMLRITHSETLRSDRGHDPAARRFVPFCGGSHLFMWSKLRIGGPTTRSQSLLEVCGVHSTVGLQDGSAVLAPQQLTKTCQKRVKGAFWIRNSHNLSLNEDKSFCSLPSFNSVSF